MLISQKYKSLVGSRSAVMRRKSQESDERQILSLGKQKSICDDLMKEYGLREIVNLEEKKSAKIVGRRPHFNRMIEMIRNREIEVVVAWQFSRLARNMQEGGLLIDLLHTGFLKAIITREKVYFPDDNTLIIAIDAASATEYSRNLSRNVNDGNMRKANLGIPNLLAPIGYVNNTHKRQGERDWNDDAKRWSLMKQVCERLLTGKYSAHQVWKWSREELNLTSRKAKKLGGKLISSSAFYRTLKRTEIAGFKVIGDKKVTYTSYTPLVTEDEYWKIQELLGRHGIPRPKQRLSVYSGYLFSPEGEFCGPDRTFRVKCSCGGKPFSGKTKNACPHCGIPIHQIQNPQYYHTTSYYNIARKKLRLGNRYVNEKKIDKFLVDFALQNLTFSKSLTQWSQNYLRDLKDKEVIENQAMVSSEKELKQSIQDQKQRAKEAFLNGTFTESEYKDTVHDLAHQEAKITSKKPSVDWFSKAMEMTTIGSEIGLVWKNGSIEDKREVLSKLGSNFLWDEEKLSITNTSEINTLISGYKTIQTKIKESELANTVINIREFEENQEAFPSLQTMWDNVRTFLIKHIYD